MCFVNLGRSILASTDASSIRIMVAALHRLSLLQKVDPASNWKCHAHASLHDYITRHANSVTWFAYKVFAVLTQPAQCLVHNRKRQLLPCNEHCSWNTRSSNRKTKQKGFGRKETRSPGYGHPWLMDLERIDRPSDRQTDRQIYDDHGLIRIEL